MPVHEARARVGEKNIVDGHVIRITFDVQRTRVWRTNFVLTHFEKLSVKSIIIIIIFVV